MKLSEHFMVEEFTASQTAARRGIDNSPTIFILANLTKLAAKMEEVRAAIGRPISISSGYRCPDLNAMVGSKPTSAHTKGLACDFHVHGLTLLDVIHAIREAHIQYDQLILEYYDSVTGGGWVHIGIADTMRNQLLTINSSGTFAGLKVA